MGMLVACVHEQLFIHLAAEAVFGKHAFYSPFDHHFRPALQEGLCGFFLTATGVTAIGIVDFLFDLVSCEFYFLTIGNDDIIATIDVRGVVCLVLAAQNGGDSGTHTSHGLIGTIYNKPSVLHGSRIRMLGSKMLFAHDCSFLLRPSPQLFKIEARK